MEVLIGLLVILSWIVLGHIILRRMESKSKAQHIIVILAVIIALPIILLLLYILLN